MNKNKGNFGLTKIKVWQDGQLTFKSTGKKKEIKQELEDFWELKE